MTVFSEDKYSGMAYHFVQWQPILNKFWKLLDCLCRFVNKTWGANTLINFMFILSIEKWGTENFLSNIPHHHIFKMVTACLGIMCESIIRAIVQHSFSRAYYWLCRLVPYINARSMPEEVTFTRDYLIFFKSPSIDWCIKLDHDL